MNRQWGLRSKLWLECDGKPVLGDGRMVMLRAIHSNGSIKLAAAETGISYRRMRGAIHDMEVTIGYALVRIQRGGGGGGGARLTPAAHKLMESFEKLSSGFQKKADARFDKLSDFFHNRMAGCATRSKPGTKPMKPFDELLKESVSRHGHLCAGQVIGVRMAMLGCRLIGIEEPKAPEHRKKLITYVEIDRCATDAIESVTGCRMGKRTLKFKDFGINAATFVNLVTKRAYRIVSTERSRDLAADYAPNATTAKEQQLEGYKKMPDDLLFEVQEVGVKLPEWELPGPPRRHTVCDLCGQMVRDGKEIRLNGNTICRPCSEESYFYPIDQAETPVLDKVSNKEERE